MQRDDGVYSAVLAYDDEESAGRIHNFGGDFAHESGGGAARGHEPFDVLAVLGEHGFVEAVVGEFAADHLADEGHRP